MSRAPLHLADSPPPDRLYVTTYCGRVLDEVVYWATPECADNAFSGWRRCAVCARAQSSKQRANTPTTPALGETRNTPGDPQ